MALWAAGLVSGDLGLGGCRGDVEAESLKLADMDADLAVASALLPCQPGPGAANLRSRRAVDRLQVEI